MQFRAYSGLARLSGHRATFGAGSRIALLHYIIKDVEHFRAKRTNQPVHWVAQPAEFKSRPFTETAVMAAYERAYKLARTRSEARRHGRAMLRTVRKCGVMMT